MIANLQPYPAYKDSDVPWLGEVPEHWEVMAVRFRYTVELGKMLDTKKITGDHLVPYLRNVDVQWDEIHTEDLPQMDVMAYEYARYTLEKGDLLVCEGGEVGRAAIWDGDSRLCAYQKALHRMRAIRDTRDLPRYLMFVLKTAATRGVFLAEGSENTIAHLTGEKLRRHRFAFPPLLEQAAIVRFLGYVDRRVRRHVRAKRRLIELLNEQRRAIIQHAVTRGLDPGVKLKPSGVDWLGDIPEHWEVMALKHVLRALIDCEHKTAPAVDESEQRVVRTTAVRHGRLRLEGTYCTTPEAFREWTRRGVPETGDVIFTREAPAGEACVVPEGLQVCLGQRTVLMKLRPERYDSQFLVHLIYGGPPAHRIKLASQGSTVGHFNMDDIASLMISAPPLREQMAINDYIEETTRPLDMVEEGVNREIGLLREYRTRLIADVVTGKLDVREAAARLPDEPEEDLDDASDAEELVEELDEQLEKVAEEVQA